MRWHGLLSLAVVVALAACTSHHRAHDHYAVMPESTLGKMMHQCSRKTPRASGAWTPDNEAIQQLENRLPQLGRQAMTLGLPAQMGEANASFRQYQGIVVDGRRLIYINALPADDLRPPGLPGVDESPMIVCDGGERFWGAVYDTQMQAFAQLQSNGRCCGIDVPPPPPRPWAVPAARSGTPQ